jgi:hypothetical protein
LKEESKFISDLLKDRENQGDYFLYIKSFASIADIIKIIIEHKSNLFLFHFAGHAKEDGVSLDSEVFARIDGIAEFLSQCPELIMVFLNGCSTAGMVRPLSEKGVPIIIGTKSKVNDFIATKFSKTFYGSFNKGNSIIQSFKLAKGAILAEKEISFRAVDFDFNEPSPHEEAWGIFYKKENESLLGSKLPTAKDYVSPKEDNPYYWNNYPELVRHFKDWNRWKKNSPEFEKFEFVPSTEIQGYQKQLISNFDRKENSYIRILGLSGLGKTRLVFELFKIPEGERFKYRLLYYNNLSQEDPRKLYDLMDELVETGEDGVLIIDNCSDKIHRSLREKLRGSQICLVTISSDHKDLERNIHYPSDDPVIIISKKDNESVIGKIISSIEPNLDESFIEKLKEFAGGFPLMAVLLAQGIESGQRFSV